MSAIGSVPSSTAAAPATQLNKDQLSMQEFMKLMVSQLQNQDPLNPMSSADFFSQMAQLGQVQGMDQLNQASQLQEAQGLLGKTVSAASTVNGLNTVVTGKVTAISLQSGTYVLGVTDQSGNLRTVNLANIESVQS